MNTIRILLQSLFATILFSCSNIGAYAQQNEPIHSLRFVNELKIEYNTYFKGTQVGGLSGIDYDPDTDSYYLISDAREARYYNAKLFISKSGLDSIQFVSVHSIDWPVDSLRAYADPEAMRLNRKTGQLVWTNEGEKLIPEKIILSPSINIINKQGKKLGNFPVPKNLTMQLDEKGPRRNGTLEGLTFDKTFKYLFTSMEEPLHEDGSRASLSQSNAWVRFYKFDVHTHRNVAQYAYNLDPVAHTPIPESAFKVNGISDILWLDEDRLLVIERSFSTGHPSCTIKLFIADLRKASNVMKVVSFIKNSPARPIEKKLLFNMESLGIYIDNIEGVTFGPDLPNGHKSLIFVSDNNFDDSQTTQLLLFEMIP